MLTNFDVNMILNKTLSFFVLSLLIPLTAISQESSLLGKADSLHREYQFEEAISIYETMLSSVKDSSLMLPLQEKIIQCENGISFLRFATTPNVVNKSSFSKNDFYLNFPDLANFSWMMIPNPLVPKGEHPYYNAVYYPENAKKLFFSAPDNSGSWNIYETDFIGGSLWSEPRLLGEAVTSSGDEIFPVLSADGKDLYFASNGHFGMGGYDLYVTHWDEQTQEWSIPENLGFPFSSTGDDLFFMNSNDGLYSLVVSNRNCSGDSVEVYAIEYVATPIKKDVSDLGEINALARLNPVKVSETIPKSEKEEGKEEEEGMSEYSRLVSQMRVLQKDMNTNIGKQKENRELYEKVENEDDREFLLEMISDLEAEAINIRAKLDAASQKVQEAEMEFLAKGIIPQFEQEKEATAEVSSVKSIPDYIFKKNSYSEIKNMDIEKPVPKFDYSFKVLDMAQMAEDQTLPPTLVYQIQILVTGNKVPLKNLKGLSPVFEKKQPSGKYLYTVGLFSSHSEALSCLNQVRKKGFTKAFIVAFNKGKSVSVRDAKVLEKKIAAGDGSSYQVQLSNYPEGIPSPIISAIRESCDKDIAKSVSEGRVIYIVGPFSKKSDADYLVKILSGLGVEGVSVESIKL